MLIGSISGSGAGAAFGGGDTGVLGGSLAGDSLLADGGDGLTYLVEVSVTVTSSSSSLTAEGLAGGTGVGFTVTIIVVVTCVVL